MSWEKSSAFFRQYEEARLERKRKFSDDVDSRLESIVRSSQETRRISKRLTRAVKNVREKIDALKSVKIHAGIYSVLDEIENESLEAAKRDMLKERKDEQKEALRPSAQAWVFVQNAKGNLRDLVSCAKSLQCAYDHQIPEEDRQKLYSLLISEVTDLRYSIHDNSISRHTVNISALLNHRQFSGSENDKRILSNALKTLRSKKYLKNILMSGFLEALFPKEVEEVRTESQIRIQATKDEKPKKIVEENGPAFSREERLEYFEVIFEFPREVAERYVDRYTLEEVDRIHERLSNVVGDTYASGLIQLNPEILDYSSKRVFTKYITTLKIIREQIDKDFSMQEELEEEFGIGNNTREYADLESLSELKQQLFAKTEGYQVDEEEFDWQEYKDSLARKAGLDPQVVAGLTEGKNASFIEGNTGTQNNFKNNLRGRISKRRLRAFEDNFLEMLKMGAIAGRGDYYQHNRDLDSIENVYLREYYRVTFRRDKVMSAKGQARLVFELEEMKEH